MSLSSLIWGQSQFDEAVDKATSELRLAEEDIALNLEICDQIRSKSVPPKDAARALKRRLNHKNPNVQLLALGLTDVCVKNGGDHFLAEVASKEFMDNLVSILRIPALNIDVRNKLLRLIQNWSVAFEGKYTLGYVGQVYRDLLSQGFHFPPKDLVVANSAMVDTSTAPEWIDSDLCLRCRTAFTFTNRKHHCRNCGQVFDQQCSSKTLPLPHFGITQEVRVCDGCYAKLNKGKREKERSQSADFYLSGPQHHHHHSASRSHSHKHRSAREFADAELQRAIQLSLQESGSASASRSTHSNYQPTYNQWQISEPPLVDRGTRPHANGRKQEEEEDPELKAAIEASLREANAPKPSAPVVTPYDEREEYTYGGSTYSNDREAEYAPPPHPPLPTLPNHDLHPRESDAILTFSQTVQDVHAQGGRDLSRFTNVHEMYDRATGLRPKLAMSLDDTGRKEEMLSEMHDKLSQAVKLYDHLLTEQLSHPTWRTASTSQQPYAAQAPLRYEGSQRPDSAQWARQPYASSPEQAYRTVGYAPPAHVQSPPSVHKKPSYNAAEYAPPTNQYAQPQPQPSDPYQQRQQPVSAPPGPSYDSYPQQQQQQQQQQPWSQLTYAESSAPQPPQQQQQQPWSQLTYAESSAPQPPQQQQQQQHQAPTPAHEYQPQVQQHPLPSQQYQPQGQQYQSQNQAYQAQPHLQHIPAAPAVAPQPPPSHHPPVQSPAPPVAQSPAPISQTSYTPLAIPPVQSPPPTQHQSYYQSPPQSTLSRHNTYSHASYASPPPVAATTLGRSNTVSYSHPQPQVSSPLPAFPTAPTSNPQGFPMYGPGPPVSGLEQTEKKEVALIDL